MESASKRQLSAATQSKLLATIPSSTLLKADRTIKADPANDLPVPMIEETSYP